MKKQLIVCGTLLCCATIALGGCGRRKKNKNEDTYEDGKLVLNLKNVYFEGWDGNDTYTKEIEDKFGVKIKPANYNYDTWSSDVPLEINARNIPDVFHYDVESFNYGSSYLKWAKRNYVKALPDDLSKWPNVKSLIENTSNIDSLKVNGKIYGLPLAYNKDNPNKTFSSFTYVYRRDWIKDIDPSLVKPNDVYTWEEFNAIIEALATSKYCDKNQINAAAIGDIDWGFPSLTNFYKDSPHCYTVDNSGRVVNAFTTDAYIQGLIKTKEYIARGLYFDQNAGQGTTKANDDFRTDKIAIFYENLSLSNYMTLRKKIKESKPALTLDQLNDRTAIMKVKGQDEKFHLEGSENWFSMSFFSADISDNKMNKILDILDYLLTEEGTTLAVYGRKGYDYILDENNEIELIEENWPKKDNGEYATKINGAKFLRSMITLNNDTTEYDPFTNMDAFNILNAWTQEMTQAKANGELAIFQERGDIKWLSTPLKDDNTEGLIDDGNAHAQRYCYNEYTTAEEYKSKFNVAKWTDTIAQINQYLGK